MHIQNMQNYPNPQISAFAMFILVLILVQEKVFSFFTHILHNFQLEYDCNYYVGDDDADDDDFGGRVRV